jgi:hypothetical protein
MNELILGGSTIDSIEITIQFDDLLLDLIDSGLTRIELNETLDRSNRQKRRTYCTDDQSKEIDVLRRMELIAETSSKKVSRERRGNAQ